MNITRHAMIRYLTRIKKIPEIINDKTYDSWKKNNEETITQSETEIQELFSETSLFTKGQFGNNKEADFYLSNKNMLVFVVQKDTILTCYPIDYDIDHKGNKEIFKTYLRSLSRLEEKQNNLLNEHKEEKTKILEEVTSINAGVEQLKKKIALLEETKTMLTQKLKVLELEEEEIAEQIYNVKNKIIRSKIAS